MRTRILSGRLLGGAAAAVLFLSAAAPAQVAPDLSALANEAYGLARSRVAPVTLDVAPDTGAILAGLQLDGQALVLELLPYSVRAPGFSVLEADGATTAATDPGAVKTLRGTIAGVPGGEAAGALLDEGLFARLVLPGGEELWLEPIAARVPGAAPADHVVYRKADVLPTAGACGTGLLAVARPVALPQPAAPSAYAGTAVATAELACDADYEYFLDHGTVGAVQDRIELVVNTMNQQYESEVGISHAITTILVRTSSSQPYTSTDAVTLLNQFRNHWNANQGAVPRDVAQLFTGKEVNGGTIGIAWIGVVCTTSYAYGLVQSDFNGVFSYATDLSAHELGHNWNADHCSCPSYTMNPYITGANAFSPTASIPPIVAFRNSISCLSSGGDPGGDPTSVHVASVTATTLGLGGGNKAGRATVVIVDDLGDPVAGATVTGTFSGKATGTVSATTNAGGTATLTSTNTGKGKFDFTFCVTDVDASLPYQPGDNAATCDSN